MIRKLLLLSILISGCNIEDNKSNKPYKVKLAKLELDKTIATLNYQRLETQRIESLCARGAIQPKILDEARYKLKIKEIECLMAKVRLEQANGD